MARLDNAATGGSLKAQLAQARARADAQWQALAERERFIVGGAALLVGLLLVWLVLVAPALRTLKTAPAALETVEQQLQQMQAQAAEVRQLRSVPPVPPEQAQAALTAAVEHLGPVARLTVTGDRAVVTLTGIAPPALQAWLAEVRAAARARPLEAQLTRGPNGYSGKLVLGLGGA